MLTDKVDMFVNLIGKNINTGMFCKNPCYAFKLVFRVNRPGRITRGTEHQEFCFRADGRFNLFRFYFKFIFNPGRNEHRFAFSYFDDLFIGNPVRGWHKYLIAGVYQAQNNVGNRLLGSGAYNDLGRFVIQVVIPFQFCADCLTQVFITRNGRIECKILIYCILGGVFYVFGGVEIGFPQAKVNNIFALCPQFAAFTRHGQCL